MSDELRDRLRRHVDVLAELIGERHTGRPENLASARRYITGELTEMGYSPDTTTFPVTGRDGVNLSVTIRSKKPRRGVLIVGAHYDTVPGTPGADDNASAVAALLEIARGFAGRTPGRDVELIFYDCEEPPHFATGDMGSQHHATNLRRSGRPVFGMICLESIGYFVDQLPPQDLPWPLSTIVRRLGGRNIVIVRLGFGLVWAALRLVLPTKRQIPVPARRAPAANRRDRLVRPSRLLGKGLQRPDGHRYGVPAQPKLPSYVRTTRNIGPSTNG